MGAGELAAEWYKSINPNGRAPAIVHVKEDGTTVKIFESAACLLYLASEFDKEGKISWEIGSPEYWVQLSWASKPQFASLHNSSSDNLLSSCHGKLRAMA